MKANFVGFYRPSAKDFKILWNEATIILDANILLNLYRYPKSASDDIFSIFKEIKNRIWIPNYAALEFQRNRLKIIADQRSRFRDVREKVQGLLEKLERELDALQLQKRHSTIDPGKFIGNLNKLKYQFIEDLNKQEKEHPSVSDEDNIREKIDKLLKGKIGKAPENQKILETIYEEGEKRYKIKSPPGYEDYEKENEFQYMNLIYKRKFGDLIIWKQIIEYVKENKIKNVIFLTDDDKEDWWWIEMAEGKKTIGPRPELLEEIVREANVKNFFMYSSERFVIWAEKYFDIKVSDESISYIRDNIPFKVVGVFGNFPLREAKDIDIAFKNWLLTKYHKQKVTTQIIPHFLVTDLNYRMGFHLKVATESPDFFSSIERFLEEATPVFSTINMDELTIVIVFDSLDSYIRRGKKIRVTIENIIQRMSEFVPASLKIMFAYAKYDEIVGFDFRPIEDFPLSL